MKLLNIKVIPNAKQTKVISSKEELRVYVKERAEDGKANKAVIEVLAEHFNVKKTDVIIVKGEKNRKKVVKIQK